MDFFKKSNAENSGKCWVPEKESPFYAQLLDNAWMKKLTLNLFMITGTSMSS